MSDREPLAGPLTADVLQALVEQSLELIAITDGAGTITWANSRFSAATGVSGGDGIRLADCAAEGAAGDSTRDKLAAGLAAGTLETTGLRLRTAGDSPLWVDVRARRSAGLLLWTFTDVSSTRFLAAQARRQGELLDTAQEFGRIGLWERRIPSGEGRWDRHVFGFWGLDPATGTPPFEEAIQRIHPDDREKMIYAESTRTAGRYSQRYRVIQPDGKTRLIHSQWAVRNGPNGEPDRAVGIMMDDTDAYESARALVDVNAQLKLAVDLGQIAIWRHDLRTQRMHYSDRAFQLLQRPPRPEGFSLEEVRSFIHPDDIALVVASAEKALASDQPTDMEARYRRADGQYRYVMTRRVVERDEAGQPVAFVGVALDVTERVEQRQQAEELARRLEAASAAAGIGLWTTAVDPDESDWNAQTFAIFDRFDPPRVPSYSEWLRESVHPEDRERVARETHAYLTQKPGRHEIEFRIVRRDGGVRWVVMRADSDIGSGARRRVLGVVMDVTEQHEALDALRDASERSAIIARHAGIGMWEARLDGSPERWDEQMFHLRGLVPSDRVPSREERMAMVHPDDLPRVLDSRPGAALATLPASYEFRVRLPDGGWRWLASRSALVNDDRGRPVRRVGVNWDVSEAKRAELVRQQAVVAEREVHAKSQFLSRMSHELRTPLNAVLGFTQLLQIEARRSADEAQLAKLGHIRAAGGHLLSLINDVLDLSSLESGALKLALGAVDLGLLVRQSVPLVESLATQHGVVVEIAEARGAARGDATRLRQVLINLLSNAIKYNRRGGRVVVHAGPAGDRALLRVRDTGRGLTPMQLASLFEPFNRFGAENEGIEGTGIGLTIVKALVEGMGGTLAVSSKPGEGTLFEVSLATATLGQGAAEPADAGDSAQAPWSEPRHERAGQILYIEDNQVNVLLVEELVKTVSGLAITSEPTGRAGVARAKALRPDLVLIDLQLPDFDGFEVLRRLRADPDTEAIPCIALSANAMPEDIERGLAAGFADYWTKPIDFPAFLTALKKRFPTAPVNAAR
ncbi:MAG: PAS domain-containing protein [Burkholderiales bacterium]|nr:PAS domain-containing protein [Burkholderiales bacterium]